MCKNKYKDKVIWSKNLSLVVFTKNVQGIFYESDFQKRDKDLYDYYVSTHLALPYTIEIEKNYEESCVVVATNQLNIIFTEPKDKRTRYSTKYYYEH